MMVDLISSPLYRKKFVKSIIHSRRVVSRYSSKIFEKFKFLEAMIESIFDEKILIYTNQHDIQQLTVL